MEYLDFNYNGVSLCSVSVYDSSHHSLVDDGSRQHIAQKWYTVGLDEVRRRFDSVEYAPLW